MTIDYPKWLDRSESIPIAYCDPGEVYRWMENFMGRAPTEAEYVDMRDNDMDGSCTHVTDFDEDIMYAVQEGLEKRGLLAKEKKK